MERNAFGDGSKCSKNKKTAVTAGVDADKYLFDQGQAALKKKSWLKGREYFRMVFSEATPEIIVNCSGALRVRVAELERGCLNVLVGLAERARQETRPAVQAALQAALRLLTELQTKDGGGR